MDLGSNRRKIILARIQNAKVGVYVKEKVLLVAMPHALLTYAAHSLMED